VVAGEWLPRVPAAAPLLEAVFMQAPAPAALLALVSCAMFFFMPASSFCV